ncbi:hypothetical protein HPG69_014023 [Diceros bicornis minor]|uniref:Ig-like domain-containing protein n=1 Tax=Diceros bicornis minor TaxID=77932 RepID=A0A7J7ENS4_DICBM|nr:hypothetical protein HPG69_014023 [Diceros bicornis minor]
MSLLLLLPLLWARPEALGNGSSLPVQQGQSLRLVCDTDSNPPARMSWTQGSVTLRLPSPSNPGVLELPRVVLGDGGEFTCQAQNPWGSYHVSVNLVVQGSEVPKGRGLQGVTESPPPGGAEVWAPDP